MIKDSGRRSQAAAEASRRNGANSKGPRSAEGKARSAMNARKHGLFGSRESALRMPSPQLRFLAGMLEELARGRSNEHWHVERVLESAVKLGEATALVGRLRSELDALLTAGSGGDEELDLLIRQLARLGRYQRRFRGQRDRALRAILKAPMS